MKYAACAVVICLCLVSTGLVLAQNTAGDITVPATIDPDLAVTSQAEIVDAMDITVNDAPACAITVRYPDADDQPVTWTDQRCSALRIEFMSFQNWSNWGKQKDCLTRPWKT